MTTEPTFPVEEIVCFDLKNRQIFGICKAKNLKKQMEMVKNATSYE